MTVRRPSNASYRLARRSACRAALGFVVYALGLVVFVASARGQDLPRVRVISTGGTIAGQAGEGQLTGAQLVAAVPELAQVAEVDVEEFSRIGSSAMTPDHWLRLSLRINEILREDRELSGVLVTHGTDTMEETGYFLHLTLEDPRPVVMVGSMRVSTAVSADGPANLLSGLRVAASEEARGRGVLVVLNDEIHSARDVRKMDNNRVDTFVSSEWGALGIVDADGVVFRRRIDTKHSVDSDVRLGPAESLPDVAIVTDFAGNDGSVLRMWADSGVAGVIVQAFGGGRASPEMRRAIDYVAALAIPVLLASRVPKGRVMGSPRNLERGALAAGDLSPHKARVLLMLALLTTTNALEIQMLLDSH